MVKKFLVENWPWMAICAFIVSVFLVLVVNAPDPECMKITLCNGEVVYGYSTVTMESGVIKVDGSYYGCWIKVEGTGKKECPKN